MIIEMKIKLHLEDNYLDLDDQDQIECLRTDLMDRNENNWHNNEIGDTIGSIEVIDMVMPEKDAT